MFADCRVRDGSQGLGPPSDVRVSSFSLPHGGVSILPFSVSVRASVLGLGLGPTAAPCSS
eukprot:2864613-Pyramimonas_sp.AAC.1